MTPGRWSPARTTRKSSLSARPRSSRRATTRSPAEPRLVAPNQSTQKELQMAYSGQIIENPVSGERITFRKTAADTTGELLEFDIQLTPDGHTPGSPGTPAQ